MEYETQIQLNRIEAKLDFIITKAFPEVLEESKEVQNDSTSKN